MPKVIQMLSITQAQTCLALLQASLSLPLYLSLSISFFPSPPLMHLKFTTIKVIVLKVK